MKEAIKLFDGIYNYNYTEGGCDDSEIFALFKSGINNLSLEEDRIELFRHFKKRYIQTWLENAEEDDNCFNASDEMIEAENTFTRNWNDQ